MLCLSRGLLQSVFFIIYQLCEICKFWLWFVMSNCEFVTFPIGILGQVWYLIVSLPDLCPLSYFVGQSTYYYFNVLFLFLNAIFVVVFNQS